MADRDKNVGSPRVRFAERTTGTVLGHAVTTKGVQPTSAVALGAMVTSVMEPMRKGKTFVPAALIDAWAEIVGPRLASACFPISLKPLPKSRSRHAKYKEGGLLEVRADPSVAVDLDYGQGLIVERANAVFGYSAIARLKVLPGAVNDGTAGSRANRADKTVSAPTSQNREQASAATDGIHDENLREALKALGSQVFAAGERRED
ncbi:MAG: DciA family protein [Pseudomonadota bacterium]